MLSSEVFVGLGLGQESSQESYQQGLVFSFSQDMQKASSEKSEPLQNLKSA